MNFQFVSTTNMLIVKDGKGLFIKRDENLDEFPGWLILPGGKQQEDETPQQAAIREVFEETGLKVINPKLKVIATHNHLYKSKVYIVYIFEATEFSGELIDYEDRKGKPLWIPLNEVVKELNLFPDLRRHIRLIQEKGESSPIFTYHKFNKDMEIVETL